MDTRLKVDNRIRILVENGVKLNHRTMFVIVGDQGKEKVTILNYLLSKAKPGYIPSVLWCLKNTALSNQTEVNVIKKKLRKGKIELNDLPPFNLFLISTDITFCNYGGTENILGMTFDMCVLQDFEAFTPNKLARTIETVKGGGIVIILLPSSNSLKSFSKMTMEVHGRYTSGFHKNIVGRFNERFILSLSSCNQCLVIDDNLSILPISHHLASLISPVLVENRQFNKELDEIKRTFNDSKIASSLISCCKTVDQTKGLSLLIDCLANKSFKVTVSLTAARGRGKSATIGLAVAGAVAHGFSSIFVTSPTPDNLKTFFEFVFIGFRALGYQENIDYDLQYSSNNKSLTRVSVFTNNIQTIIQYINPTEAVKLDHAQLLVIDEAAAIPLPFVKEMFGPYCIFLSSTINGYEGTGRSLSLKLLNELRRSSCNVSDDNSKNNRTLKEITLEEPIRYNSNDPVESWLNELFCLNACSVDQTLLNFPPPNDCDLYYVNRDTLFSYHTASEAFLKRVMSLYVSSHYKNSPNDLQLISDAPNHHLFCLLGPINDTSSFLPDIFCVLQVCFEGRLSTTNVKRAMSEGVRLDGDLIPWTIAQQFQKPEFATLSGLRIIRIATHPECQSMGYGSRALSLLSSYFNRKLQFNDNLQTYDSVETFVNEDENILNTEIIKPKSNLPPLLLRLEERIPEDLDYIGVAYGLTSELLKFWKRAGFTPVYLRQTSNEITDEHSCIMLKVMNNSSKNTILLTEFWSEFIRRFSCLLSYQFKKFPTSLALGIFNNNSCQSEQISIGKENLYHYLSKTDMSRLHLYCNNLIDYHLILDLIPTLSRMVLIKQLTGLRCSNVQSTILIGLGLQHKTIEEVCSELEIQPSQGLGLFSKSIKGIYNHFVKLVGYS